MRLNEVSHTHKIDLILYRLCDMVKIGQEKDSDKYGMVAACIIDPKKNIIWGINYANKKGHRTHAERAAIEKYEAQYSELPEGSIIVSTLSPCSKHMHDRLGASCTDLLNKKRIKKVYCGYLDPTQEDSCEAKRNFVVIETNNQNIKKQCMDFADTFL